MIFLVKTLYLVPLLFCTGSKRKLFQADLKHPRPESRCCLFNSFLGGKVWKKLKAPPNECRALLWSFRIPFPLQYCWLSCCCCCHSALCLLNLVAMRTKQEKKVQPSPPALKVWQKKRINLREQKPTLSLPPHFSQTLPQSAKSCFIVELLNYLGAEVALTSNTHTHTHTHTHTPHTQYRHHAWFIFLRFS